MNTPTSSVVPSRPSSTVTGEDVNRIRAALNLHRAELAEALGVHVASVIRWENLHRQPIPAEGLPLRLLSALRDRVVVEGAPLEESRASGRYVAQSLLRNGSLEATAELIRFANARTLRRIVEADDE
jgi:DNA-binding transcriptional regulator YiaG